MGKSKSARLRVKSSGFKFELEACEEFVSIEYPKLLGALSGIARALVVIHAEELGAKTASAQSALTDLDQEMQQLKRQLDSLGDLSQTDSLRLQNAMDQMSEMASILSNILKQISDTAQSITQNLK